MPLTSLRVAAGCLALAAGLVVVAEAQAAEIKLLSASGLQPALLIAIPEFERVTTSKVSLTYGLPVRLKQRIVKDDAEDVAILPTPLIRELIREGKLVTGSNAEIARSALGVAVHAGAPKPNIDSPDALKRALLDAKAIAYASDGSGAHFLRVVDRLGIADAVKPKLKDAQGNVGKLVATGKADLGVQAIPAIMQDPGVELVGPLPGELQSVTAYSAALSTGAKEPEGGKALIRFLSGSTAQAAFKAAGFESTPR